MPDPDVVVVGAGPAGISAALALAGAGVAVTLVDEQVAPGGQVYRAVDRVIRERPHTLDYYGADYARGRELTGRLPGSGIELALSTSVWELCREAGAVKIGLISDSRARVLSPRHVILAGGAMERPTPFPGWTLPGVMTVGAAQTLFKESALVPEKPPVICGRGPLVYLFTRQLLAAGLKSAVLLDCGSAGVPAGAWPALPGAIAADPGAFLKGLSWLRAIRRSQIDHQYGIGSLRAIGADKLEAIEYTRQGKTVELETGLLLVHDGVIPNCHLSMAAGCEHRWNEQQGCWQPLLDDNGRSSHDWLSICGDGATIGGAEAAALGGRLVGSSVAHRLGAIDADRFARETAQPRRMLARAGKLRRYLDMAYPPTGFLQGPFDDQTPICRCEGVVASEIRSAAAIGCMGPNQAKAFTRCGMGPCMGRQCGNAVSRILALFHRKSVAEMGYFNIRPPLKPVTVGELARMEMPESAGTEP